MRTTPIDSEGEQLLAADDDLATLVRRHQMQWHVRPELADLGGELVTIGFVVELTATHDAPSHPPAAGCDECVPVRRALERVATAVLPKGEHASWYEITIPPAQLQFSGRRAELVASIVVLHRGTVNRPADECERACLHEIRTHLSALGAHER